MSGTCEEAEEMQVVSISYDSWERIKRCGENEFYSVMGSDFKM